MDHRPIRNCIHDDPSAATDERKRTRGAYATRALPKFGYMVAT